MGQYKAQRSPKETPQDLAHLEYLQKLEAAKSFELDDDEVFCPFHLLTEDDLQSIHSASSSDRGSLSSGSPEGSPLQQQIQPTPSFLLSTAPNTFGPEHSFDRESASFRFASPADAASVRLAPLVEPALRPRLVLRCCERPASSG